MKLTSLRHEERMHVSPIVIRHAPDHSHKSLIVTVHACFYLVLDLTEMIRDFVPISTE